MKVKELPGNAKVGDYKLKIPPCIKQPIDEPLEEGYLVSFHANPGGWFMSADPPGSKTRRLVPTYGDNQSILEWEIVEEDTKSE